MKSFWQKLKKPIIGAAPMDGVTDAAFRYILSKYGNPDLIFTEFIHVQGLWQGKLSVFTDLIYENNQRPIVAQLFGSDPDYFYKAAHIICELGFDGIDINMGCPADSIVKKGGGAWLIKNPKLAQTIIKKTKQGVKAWIHGQTLQDLGLETGKISYIQKIRKFRSNKSDKIPISVKTRIGFERNNLDEWIKYLIEANPDAITVHGRTFKQLYSGRADWEIIGSVSELVHQAKIIYLGNGGVLNLDQAKSLTSKYKLDGVLIGRASLGNPWIFSQKNQKISAKIKLQTALEHAKIHQKIKGSKRFIEIRKHLGWYCKGFNQAKKIRLQLMQVDKIDKLEKIISNYINE